MKDFEIRCDKSHLEENNSLYGKFTLGPFLPGQGTTFGNALRRSLLAELSGLAITAFEVIGVMQEFSTLPGLRESILDLSLNLKQIVLTGFLPHSTPPIGFLNIRGPAIVKAIDLRLPAGIYCASPNQYIATLGSTGMLNIKFLVSVGKGYSIQPYSLYRSLSKIKLQPTLNFENANIHSASSSRFFEQSIDFVNNKSSIENSQSIFNTTSNVKDMGNRVGVNPLNPNPLERLAVQNLFGDEKTSKDKLNNFVGLRNDLRKSKKSFSVANQGFAQENESQSLNSESSLLTFVNTATTLNSSEYTTIQKQIFQRINPHQVLPIDAVFTPVSRVNFLTQVNDRFETPRENIVLEIWTNGSIHPKRALEEATLSLVQNFDTLLKKIQQSSSFYKGIRYWTYLQPFDFLNNEKNETLLTNSYKEKRTTSQPENSEALTIDKTEELSYNRREADTDPQRGYLQDNKLIDNTSNLSIPPSASLSHRLAEPNGITETERGSTNVKKTLKKNFWADRQAIYNLDLGNLNLSLQTFISLKKAKIHTLSQLLTLFSLKDNKLAINSTKIQVENCNTIFLNEKIIKELNSVVNHFST